tara:strand:- start:7401 stop:8717 length:1317 start_codon:yes stop_codon:yes gene_type:complete
MVESEWGQDPAEDANSPLFGRVRLRTLLVLRWLAIAGQTAAILIVQFVLGFDLPLMACSLAILASVGLNVALLAAQPLQRLVTPRETFLQLAYDVAQLTLLLILTGGLRNPFVIMMVAPVTVGIAALPPRWSVLLGSVALGSMALMAIISAPLPWGDTPPPFIPSIYVLGLATAFVITVAFTAAYAWRIGREATRMGAALAATQSVLAREQKLSALGAMAAAAAHELGTPLATIQLTAKEMARDARDGPLKEDADLLVSQAERCRDILQRLSRQGETSDKVHDQLSLEQALEEVSAPFRGLGASIAIRVEPSDTAQPVLARRAEFLHGLTNLVENAVEFAQSEVCLQGRWTPESLEIIINDDGHGFSPDMFSKIGEPYISSRKRGEPGGGLGLGLFIAITLIERIGGTAHFANGGDLGGALVIARWPRGRVEAPGEAR